MKVAFESMAIVLILFCLSGCVQKKLGKVEFESPTLQIKQLSQNTYVHISYLELSNGQRFPCNGLIFISDGEAIVFDTPVSDSASHQLIDWIEIKLNCEVKGIVVNHFHVDCLGGLAVFHDKGIASFGNQQTVEIARKSGNEVPQIAFADSLETRIGNQIVIHRFFGPGHTSDNIVSYIPSENLLFGGCMIKEVGAGKGNLADADLPSWPATVRAIKTAYPNLLYIVPGHGQVGGIELLDYTIDLFENSH